MRIAPSIRSLLLPLVMTSIVAAAPAGRIRPWPEDPRRWEYRGEPVLLLGASDDDNIFQRPELESYLERLRAAGVNYLRNTMSDRPDKGFEVYPFFRRPDGKYDLDRWNPEYWLRFENFLRWSEERGIIVQIEIWDRFDYADHRAPRWTLHPYNPKNNVNYTEEETGLRPTYRKHPGSNEQPFFFSVPALRNIRPLLEYQEAFVAKLLSISLRRGNVLYCMDNETGADPRWGEHWARFIGRKAKEAGVDVYATEMWDAWDLKSRQHRNTLDHPELYSFADISQNNHNNGQAHWDNLQWARRYTAKRPRPLNCVKIYGADTGHFGTDRDGVERFWRNILGGAASSRFHRPGSGLGSSDRAFAHVRSARLLERELDLARAEPDASSAHLGERVPNEAYLTRVEGRQYAVWFPDGGSVRLDLAKAPGKFALKWLDIAASRWGKVCEVQGGRSVPLKTPGKGYWLALLKRTGT